MNDSLGNRMKAYYEDRFRYYLPMRMPVILRVDGKSFHTYTRSLPKPWSDLMSSVMDRVAIHLCSEIAGVEMAYIQSDEISLLIHNYKRVNSQAWFDNNIQKMCSISAAMASTYFTLSSKELWPSADPFYKIALFDSRVFVLPEAEVCNYFIWRQLDATRNAIQSLARAHFSHKQCDHKNGSELQEMLFTEKAINFNDLSPYYKRGRCVRKGSSGWVIDKEIPVFTQDRSYIEDLLRVEE